MFLLVAILALSGPLFANGPTGFYYIVKQNETLPILASRFGVSARELSSANRVAVNARLVPGARVWIPKPPPSGSRAPAPTPALSASTSASKPRIDTGGSRPSAPAPAVASSRSSSQPAGGYVFTDSSTYIVKRGDSLWSVAKAHGISIEDLARINRLSPRAGLEVGQKLDVKPSAPPTVRDIPGGGVEAPSFRTMTQSSDSPPPSRPIPNTRPSSKGYIWPVEGRVIRRFTQRSEEKYMGIDIAVPRGTEVRASRDGEVVYADEISFYGKMVVIEHEGKFATCYGQLSRILVSKGQKIRQGQVIARTGEGGRGSDDYLHFELRRNGEAINPEPYLP